MPKVRSGDLIPLMREASHKAAEAREAGDMEGYRTWKARSEAINRAYRGFGSAEDEIMVLEAKRGLAGTLEAGANMIKWGLYAGLAILLYTQVGKRGRA